MPKQPELHPHSDRPAFDRLMLLIATFLRYPGVGGRDPLEAPGNHNALEEVRSKLKTLANELGFTLSGYSVPTLRKDLSTLRHYNILEPHMYRWGYYLGTGVMSADELRLALQSLRSQAQAQGDAKAKLVYDRLCRRLGSLDGDRGDWFYPVRQHLTRAIIDTDPNVMVQRQAYADNLFHQLDQVEDAIQTGQALELAYHPNLGRSDRAGIIQVIPLQLLYYDVAWYLLCDTVTTGHLSTYRINRLGNYCNPLPLPPRGIEQQRLRLKQAHILLERGWGLFLGEPDAQRQELAGTLPLTSIHVRFFPPVAAYILEGNRRHPHHRIVAGAHNPTTGTPDVVDYFIQLPDRSLGEFSRWVDRYKSHALVLKPSSLAATHKAAAAELARLYGWTVSAPS